MRPFKNDWLWLTLCIVCLIIGAMVGWSVDSRIPLEMKRYNYTECKYCVDTKDMK